MPKLTRPLATVLVTAGLLTGSLPVLGQSYLDLEGQVREFTLENGIHFLVLERHDVPVFAFNTYVDVGSSDEVTGITGIAHILEHMAFKGTSVIGTEDPKAELKAMQAEDAAFLALKAERAKGEKADPEKLAALEKAFEEAKDAAREFVVTNEFGQIIENNGGRGLNASTWTDATNYFYMLPSNRLELWAYLEGSRMANPVLREFYTEKDGPVTEERRMRTDNSPFGMLIEQFQNLAYIAHPYHHSTIGYMSDLESITREDCQDFYDRFYVGQNITVAVVGDVEFDEVQKVARKYFAAVSGAPAPKVETIEPPQLGERRQVIEHTSQPIYMIGYHIGDAHHPDEPVYNAIADILGQGRTSRLYKVLVKQKKMAVQAFSFAGFPDNKYPSLMAALVVPAKGVTALEVEEVVLAEIDKIVAEGVTADELAGVKQRARADFLRGLRSNQGLARQLSYFQGRMGDWRTMFDQVAQIEAVTLEDVQRVAKEIFVKNNRTVAYIETVEDEES